jgi:hypothetical protein
MPGREFLELARELVAGKLPRHWRAAVIHAYYALFLECRDAMTRWGLPRLPQHQVHAQVRLRLAYATDADLQDIARVLDALVKDRNRASYDLSPLPMFASAQKASQDVQDAARALALLDMIDSDPVRRTAAIAGIRP